MEGNEDRLLTVQTMVKRVFESLNAYSNGKKVEYCYCSFHQFNATLQEVSGPTLIHVIPVSGELLFGDMNIQDVPDAQFCFADLMEFDFDGEEHDQIVERMKRLAADFVTALNNSHYFEPLPDRIEYKVPINTMDENLTGIIISPKLREVDGLISCDGESWHRIEEEKR